MPLANIYRVVQDVEGNVVTGVLGTVTLSGTSTLAALFADADGTLPLPNPTTNNAQYGSFSLFVGAGTYTMQFVKAGYTFETQYNITMRDPAAGVNVITGTANQVLVAPVSGVGNVTLSLPQSIAPDSSVQFAHIGVGTPATSAPIAYADPPAARTALGLGTMATQDANNVAITGGSAVVSTLNVNMTTTRGSLTAQGGIFVPNYTPSTNDPYALFGDISAGANRFNLFLQGTASNFLGGSLLLKRASEVAGVPASLLVSHAKATTHGIVVIPNDTDTGGGMALQFVNTGGGTVGTIATTATTTAYNTSSDVRLKRNVTTLVGELAVIRALRPVRFRWLSDDSEGVGFLAQEVAEHVQGVVTGAADAVDDEGQIVPQQIDYSKLVPWIVGAMQTIVQRLEVVEDAAGV